MSIGCTLRATNPLARMTSHRATGISGVRLHTVRPLPVGMRTQPPHRPPHRSGRTTLDGPPVGPRWDSHHGTLAGRRHRECCHEKPYQSTHAPRWPAWRRLCPVSADRQRGSCRGRAQSVLEPQSVQRPTSRCDLLQQCTGGFGPGGRARPRRTVDVLPPTWHCELRPRQAAHSGLDDEMKRIAMMFVQLLNHALFTAE